LSARAEHQKERVIASLTWDDGHTTSHSFTPLGELVIQSGWDQWRSSAGYDLVKDLTLPVVLLVLATALGFYDKHRENVRHRKQEELEERRKQDAELRAQTAQTWTSMLPESHKLATTYYMPIDAARVPRWTNSSTETRPCAPTTSLDNLSPKTARFIICC
jgi:hypothetical protein